MTNRFPHILPADAKVWTRFLELHGKDFSHFDYDIRVGLGTDPGDIVEQKYRDMAITLSQRRIDAVGYSDNRIYIIEITQRAGIKALGQLVAYPALYRETFASENTVFPLLVCSSFKSDAESAFISAKIPYIVVDV